MHKQELKSYQILRPFRLGGLWNKPEQKTVLLTKRQAIFLLLNGKVAALAPPKVEK